MAREDTDTAKRAALGSRIQELADRAWEESQAHYEAAKPWRRVETILSILAPALAAAAGFGGLAKLLPAPGVEIVALCSAVLGAVLAWLYRERRAEKHHTAGLAYGQLRRSANSYISTDLPWSNPRSAQSELTRFEEEYGRVSQAAPPRPDSAYRHGLERIGVDRGLPGPSEPFETPDYPGKPDQK